MRLLMRSLLPTLLAVVLIGCGAPTAPPTPSATVGLEWATASVDRPAGFEIASPVASAQPQGPGGAGHPGHFSGQAHMVDVAASGDGLVAVGYRYPGWRATAWSTTDGMAWNLASVAGDDEGTFMYAVATDTTRLVAVGLRGSHAGAWWSEDGTTWQTALVDEAPGDVGVRMTAAAESGGAFVAGGSSGVVTAEGQARFWRSTDGTTWDPAVLDQADDGRVAAIAPGTSTIVAIGTTGPLGAPTGSAAWTSADGATWLRSPAQETLAGVVLRSVTPYGPGFVAVGDTLDGTRAAVLRSEDGFTWRAVEQQASFSYHDLPIRMTDVTVLDDDLVAVGHHLFGQQYGYATSWVSEDGGTWRRAGRSIVFPQAEMLAVAVVGDRVVAVGTYGAPDNFIPTAWFSPP